MFPYFLEGGKPRNINIVEAANSIKATWDEPQILNGEIKGYHATITLQGEDKPTETQFRVDRSVLFERLNAFTDYIVSVATENAPLGTNGGGVGTPETRTVTTLAKGGFKPFVLFF